MVYSSQDHRSLPDSVPFLFDSLENYYQPLLGHPLREFIPKLRKDEIG